MVLNEIRYPVELLSLPHLAFLSVLLLAAVFLAVFLSGRHGYKRTIILICAFVALACEIEKLFFFIGAGYGYRLSSNLCPFKYF